MTCGLIHVLTQLCFIIKLLHGPLSISCHTERKCKSELKCPNLPEKWNFYYIGMKCHSQVGQKNMGTKCHRLWDKLLQRVRLSHCNKPSTLSRSECHNFGWTDNLSTLRWNVTVVNCHSRRFVRCMLRLDRIVIWLVCGWTDRQGTPFVTCLIHKTSC